MVLSIEMRAKLFIPAIDMRRLPCAVAAQMWLAGVSPVPVQMRPGGGASAEGAASLPDSGASARGRPLCRGVPAD